MNKFSRPYPNDKRWTGETGQFFDPKPIPDNRAANIKMTVPESFISVQNTPAQSALTQEVRNRIDHPSDIEQAQEMVPTSIVLAVVSFVGFMLSALFWVVFQLVK